MATSQLVKEILDYSSIGFLEEEKEEVIKTVEIIHEIGSLLHIPENIEFKVSSDIPLVKISKIRIHQIFQNLISNAIKFNNKKEGKIEIGANKLNSDYWEFFVKDNGIGIPEEDIDSLFQVFKTINKSPESTGLGLAIVKKIVQFYGGDVKINSNFGHQTTVFFTLPSKYVVLIA